MHIRNLTLILAILIMGCSTIHRAVDPEGWREKKKAKCLKSPKTERKVGKICIKDFEKYDGNSDSEKMNRCRELTKESLCGQ